MAGINFSGLASGIDSNAIIQSVVDARNIQKVPFQNKIKINEDENSAYSKLRELLGVLNDKASIFQTFKGSAVAKTVKSSNPDVISSAVSGNASTGTVAIKVNQLASSARITFDNTFTNPNAIIAPSLSGPEIINISIGTGALKKDYAVEIESTTTFNELVNKISEAGNGEFSASSINIGTSTSPQYKLMISGLETGIEKGTLELTLGPELDSLGILTSQTINQADNSIVEIPGIGLVTRGSNILNDLFPGLSVEIKQVSASPILLSISNDIDSTAQRVLDFVSSYNELKKYIDENGKITRVNGESGEKNAYGSLARTRVDDEILTTLRDTFRNTLIDGGSEVRILADLGIETNKDTGLLEVKEDILKVALAKDPQGSGELLSSIGDKLASVNGVIYGFTKFKGLIDGAETSNKDEDDFSNSRIERIEANIQKQREYLLKLFATLESTTARLQSGATALTSLITQNNK